MKIILNLLLVVTLISCSETTIKNDFVRSNWGDDFSLIESTYEKELGFNQSADMITYNIKSLKDTAVVGFLFSDNKLISGFVNYNQKEAKDSKKLYDAYVKKNRDKFGLENYIGKTHRYEDKKFEERIWGDDKNLVSVRLDSLRIRITYYDKTKMPVN